ncbi:MAG: 1-deoxy-D-xylulose-5-phosphate reductoisomerase, partial [Dialister sp.]|nr:1-deoxy-D-xylulose-5-phosphate reductoisomerase [Dialister sp.]
ATTVFNAANEEAISGFINGQISFLEIFDVVEETLNRNVFYEIHSLEDLRQADLTARKTAGQIINKGYSC